MHGTNPPIPPADERRAVVKAVWRTWTCDCELSVTRPQILGQALSMVQSHMAQVEVALSKFLPDSEVCRLAQASQPINEITPLLAEYLRAGLQIAAMTNGKVDPTVGSAMPAGWRSLELHGTQLTMPPGTLLDLGASAKAYAADYCAAMVATEFDADVLLNLGGDVSTASAAGDRSKEIAHGLSDDAAGPSTDIGWQVTVQDAPGEPTCQVELGIQAGLATSSTLHRYITEANGAQGPHIVDPLTGLAIHDTWRTVTVAADTCSTANGLSTAALVARTDAVELLADAGWPARLVAQDGTVIHVAGWPQ